MLHVLIDSGGMHFVSCVFEKFLVTRVGSTRKKGIYNSWKQVMCGGGRWLNTGQGGILLESKITCRQLAWLSCVHYLKKNAKNQDVATTYGLQAIKEIIWGSYMHQLRAAAVVCSLSTDDQIHLPTFIHHCIVVSSKGQA